MRTLRPRLHPFAFRLALPVCVVVAGAGPAPRAHAAQAPAVVEASPAVYLDEGVALTACTSLLAAAVDPVRVAVIVDDTDVVRRAALERVLVRALRSRGREDVVTPALVRGTLDDAARAQLQGGAVGPLRALSADHVIIGVVNDEGRAPALRLRLLSVQTGAVLADARVDVAGTGKASSAGVLPVTVAVDDMADAIADAVESTGAQVRQSRIAVVQVEAAGAAKNARLDVFVHNALGASLRARGFLVVERAQLQAATDQLALGQSLGEDGAAKIGQMLGAQQLVFARVDEAGTEFLLRARVVDVTTAQLLGATQATVHREGVVDLAAVETRTPLEAAMFSAIAPGWGQVYNREPAKAVWIGVPTWSALGGTIGLGAGTFVVANAYANYRPAAGDSAQVAATTATSLRETANTLALATAIAGGVTVGLWTLGVVDAATSVPVR